MEIEYSERAGTYVLSAYGHSHMRSGIMCLFRNTDQLNHNCNMNFPSRRRTNSAVDVSDAIQFFVDSRNDHRVRNVNAVGV